MKNVKIFLFAIALFFIWSIASVYATPPYTGVPRTVTFSKTGSGSGVIKSDLTGDINCGTVCSKGYGYGSYATFSAVPDEGSIFTGWSGFKENTNYGTNDAKLTLYIYEDFDLVAQFEKISVGDVKITTNPDGTLQATFDISFNNEEAITAGGFVYGLNANPEWGWIGGYDGYSANPTTGLVDSSIAGVGEISGFQTNYSFNMNEWNHYLKPNTTYHVRSIVNYKYLGSHGITSYESIYGKDISFKTGLPDLSSVLDTYPVSTDYGFAEVAVNVSNTGNYFAKGPFNVLVEQSSAADGGGTISAIGAGGTDIFYTLFDDYLYINKSIGQGTLQYGLHGKSGDTVSIRSCIDQTFLGDKNGVITESDESDASNCSAWHNILIKRVPSVWLTVTPQTGSPGINPIITWRVSSDTSVISGRITTSCKASGDWSGDKDVNGGTEYVGPLNTEKTYNYILTCTNSDGNGFDSASVTVSAPVFPDLQVSVNVTPTATTVGDTKFSATIKNVGTATTGAGFTNLFQTATSIVDLNNPTGLLNYAVPGMDTLAPGATAVTTKTLTLAVGKIYIRVCADKRNINDTNGQIDEGTNEGNNCSEWVAVIVTGATCTDGIKNQDETSIDKGGVCGVPGGETCFDKIKNQNETGIDTGGVCGGPGGETCFDKIKNQNETSIDKGGVCGTCFDKIKNQDETSIDKGGVCASCVCINGATNIPECTIYSGTCFDKIKNQDETGIDTGGVCGGPGGETCFDKIKNQNETGIDTGGVCGGGGTCIDGIKNQNETSIDKGGVCGKDTNYNER